MSRYGSLSVDFVSVSFHGVGKHQWDVPLSEIPFILRLRKQKNILLGNGLTY